MGKAMFIEPERERVELGVGEGKSGRRGERRKEREGVVGL